MFQVLVVSQIRVYPVAERKLFLVPYRVGRTFAGRSRRTAQPLEVLLFRNNLLEGRARLAGFQFLTQLLELLEAQPSLLLWPALVVVLLDHPAHFVTRHLEAALVQSVAQLRQVDEPIAVLVDLRNENRKKKLVIVYIYVDI